MKMFEVGKSVEFEIYISAVGFHGTPEDDISSSADRECGTPIRMNHGCARNIPDQFVFQAIVVALNFGKDRCCGVLNKMCKINNRLVEMRCKKKLLRS